VLQKQSFSGKVPKNSKEICTFAAKLDENSDDEKGVIIVPIDGMYNICNGFCCSN
jgi:hypothetical protein